MQNSHCPPPLHCLSRLLVAYPPPPPTTIMIFIFLYFFRISFRFFCLCLFFFWMHAKWSSNIYDQHTHTQLAYALSLTGNSSDMSAPKTRCQSEAKTKQNRAKWKQHETNMKQTKYYFSHKCIYRVYRVYRGTCMLIIIIISIVKWRQFVWHFLHFWPWQRSQVDPLCPSRPAAPSFHCDLPFRIISSVIWFAEQRMQQLLPHTEHLYTIFKLHKLHSVVYSHCLCISQSSVFFVYFKHSK